jgi:hypothetical protein
MKKKPIIFLIFKLIGLVGFGVFIFGLVKLINGFGNFEDNSFIVGSLTLPLGLFLTFTGLVLGFRPEITKHSIKTAKYIQQENQEDLKEIMTTTAQINSEAVEATAKAVKKGLGQTMYCKHCGQEVDIDSQFCKYCGRKL